MLSKYYSYFRLFRAMMKMSRNPEDTTQVFEISDALHGLGLNNRMIAKLTKNPAAHELIRKRYRLPPIQLVELQKLPEGTLGRIYADHMISNKLDPNFYRVHQIREDIDYIVIRNRETHDFWHVVAGFDTSRIGELSVHGLMMAQLESPISSMLVAGSLLRYGLGGGPQVLPRIWRGITKGYTIGSTANSLFAADWESLWPLPMEEVRRKLNLVL